MVRSALVIGVDSYAADKSLAKLPAAAQDLEAVTTVLRERGDFEVRSLRNPDRKTMERELEDLFNSRRFKREDTVLVYFSGHGLTDEPQRERLYLAATDTEKDRLDSSAVNVSLLQQFARTTKAGTRLLFLDCCFAGIAGDGLRARGGQKSVRKRLECHGTVVFTATDRTSPSFEDTQAVGEPSFFTRTVVDGLGGKADDRDGDGWISVQDLAAYVQRSEELRGHQTPQLFFNGVTGDIPLARTDGYRPPAFDVAAASNPAGVEPEHPRTAPLDADTWKRLLRYYADCLRRDASLSDWLKPSDHDRFGYWPAGPEQVFTGPDEALMLPESLSGFAPKTEEDAQLNYGYPVVRVQVEHKPRFAPLFTAPLIVTPDGAFEAGQIELNPVVLEHYGLEPADIVEISEKTTGQFQPGRPEQFVLLVQEVAKAIGAPTPETPDPARLSERLRLSQLTSGVHNVAVVYRSDPAQDTVKGLVKDLTDSSRHAMKHVLEFPSTALGALMDSSENDRAGTYELVAPGPLNESQEAIVEAAMTRRLTVATGPPGTGKTALVAALTVTAACNGQSILIGSANNEAVNGVQRAADGIAPGLVIRTGKKQFIKAEPDILRGLLDTYKAKSVGNENLLRGTLRRHTKQIDELREALDHRVELENDLLAVHRALERVKQSLKGCNSALALADGDDRRLGRAAATARRSLRRRPTGIVARWWLRRRFGLADTAARQALTELCELELDRRGIRSELGQSESESALWEGLKRALQARQVTSRELANAVMGRLVNQGRRVIEDRIRLIEDDKSSWIGFEALQRFLPGWAGTGHSANNILPKPALFDLVVIDEAAQCPIPVVLTMLMRAKRALIIGDPHQIPPITNLSKAVDDHVRRRHRLGEDWLQGRSLQFRSESVYSACAAVANEEFLLDEHYRCDPAIIAVPNRIVYQDRLTVLTDLDRLTLPADPDTAPAVTVIDVPGSTEPPRSGSWRNPQEAEAVLDYIADLRQQHPEVTFGVVTPYAAQSRLIEGGLRSLGLQDVVKVGTAHRFQGGECDVIVISAVGSGKIPAQSERWLVDQTNLWNVAITRAKSRLVVCCDRRWWSARRSLLTDLIEAEGLTDLGEETHPELLDNLQWAINDAGIEVKNRRTLVSGQPCDLLLPTAPEEIAIALDATTAGDGKRHRQLLTRLDLIAAGGSRPVRVPAWRAVAEPEMVAAEVKRLGSGG